MTRDVDSSGNDRRLVAFYGVSILQAMGWSMYGIISTFFAMGIGVTATNLGIAWALNELSQFLAAPALGRVTDALGRKPILIACFTWCAAIMALTAFTRNAMEYILARGASGIGQPVQSLLVAVLTDLVPEKERSARFGSFMGITFGTFVIGCCIGVSMTALGLLLSYGVLVAAAVLFLSAGAVFFLKETLPIEKRRSLWGIGGGGTARGDPDSRVTSHWKYLLSVGLSFVWLSRITSSFALVCWMLTYPYVLSDAFGWGAVEFGSIVIGCCLVMAPVQTWAFPWIDRRLGCHVTGAAGQILLAPAMAVLPFSVMLPSDGKVGKDYWVSLEEHQRITRLIFHFTTVFFLSVAYAIIEVSIPRLVAAYVSEPGLMGMAQGITSSCRSVGFVLGSVCAGAFYDMFGLKELYFLAAFVASLGGAAIGFAYCFGSVSEQTPESRGLSPTRTPARMKTPGRSTQTEETPLMA